MPNREAVIHGDATITWAELDDRTTRLCHGLRELGIGQGDRIGLIAPNCLEYLEIVIAGFKLGAITVPLNHRLTASELSFIVGHAGCSAVISHASFSDVTAKALDLLAATGETEPVTRIGTEPGFGEQLRGLYAAESVDSDVHVDASDVAFICYTSGTTGLPKGAMLTHGNVLATSYLRNLADNLGQDARLYLPAPLSFTGTLVMLWSVNYVGGGVTVLDTTVDARQCLEAIHRYSITDFVAVPVVWERMARDPNFEKYDLSSLRVCITGGANVTESFLRSMWDRGIPVRNSYGLTEGSSCSTWQSLAESQRDPVSVGHATIFNQIRIVDHNDEALTDVPQGDIGEIAIRGPEVMLGYWDDPAATDSTLVDGWLRTGDLGRLTEDSFLHVAGRVKDMLISGGINVYPAEIEEVLAKIEGVLEVSVIGVADEVWGETPAAIIHPSPNAALDPATIRAYCATYLADYKLPRYVVIRGEPLPRNMSGKILKRELVQEYSVGTALGPPLK